MHLFVSTVDHPTVRYALPRAIDASSFVCLNVRSSNLSSFLEHNQKWLAINEERRADPWHFDETQKSRPCMNVATRNQLRAIGTDVARDRVVHVLADRADRRAFRHRLRGSVRATLTSQ